jgi:hypothetical protein
MCSYTGSRRHGLRLRRVKAASGIHQLDRNVGSWFLRLILITLGEPVTDHSGDRILVFGQYRALAVRAQAQDEPDAALRAVDAGRPLADPSQTLAALRAAHGDPGMSRRGGGTRVRLTGVALVHAPGRRSTTWGAGWMTLGTFRRAERRSRMVRQLTGRLTVPIARFTENANLCQIRPHRTAPMTPIPLWMNTCADLGVAEMRLRVP